MRKKLFAVLLIVSMLAVMLPTSVSAVPAACTHPTLTITCLGTNIGTPQYGMHRSPVAGICEYSYRMADARVRCMSSCGFTSIISHSCKEQHPCPLGANYCPY